jgi:heptaprenyl diphosphate synthase
MTAVKKTAFMGLMLAVILVLAMLEHMLPPLPLLPPNVRFGLSNIVTMYCVFFIGRPQAVTLNILKSFFVLLTRGPLAGLLSLSGGMLSILVIILLVWVFKEKISYAAISIAGACAHNLGQYAVVSLILDAPYLVYYLPVLLGAGVATGLVTGALLVAVMPLVKGLK